MTLQLARSWEGHNQGLLTLSVESRTHSFYLPHPDKIKVCGAWQTGWRLLKERKECTTLHSRQRMTEMWSCGRPWWKAVLSRSKEDLSDRTGRWSQQVLILGGHWPTGSSQVHLPSPLPFSISSPTTTRREVVQESIQALPADHGPILRRNLRSKTLGWKEHCSDKSQKSSHLILSCSACHSTELLFNC